MGGGATKLKDAESWAPNAEDTIENENLEKVEDLYRMDEILGQGSFAVVFKAKLKVSARKSQVHGQDVNVPEYVAIKAINKRNISEADRENLVEECHVMGSLHHTNLVALYEWFDSSDTLHLVLELVSGGELFDQILEKGSFCESDAANVCKQVGEALAYMGEKGVVHRDLKPENIIFSTRSPDSHLKITDFGLAKNIFGKGDCLDEPCGTPGYVAPEILKSKKYGLKVDTWALGVILYTLLCGYPPFYDEDQPTLFRLIKSGRYDLDKDLYWDTVSNDAKHVVRRLLTVDPEKRASAKELLELDWVKNHKLQSEQSLGSHVLEGMEKLQKNKRFRQAVKKVQALRKFDQLLHIVKHEHENEENEEHAPAPVDRQTSDQAPGSSRPALATTPVPVPTEVVEKTHGADAAAPPVATPR